MGDTPPDEVLSRPLAETQLKTAKRKEWYPRCEAQWETLKVEVPTLVRNPDGTVPLDSEGHCIYRKATRPLFDPDEPPPDKQATGRFGQPLVLWLGLAADDVACKRRRLSASDSEVRFLIERTPSWPLPRPPQIRPYQRKRKCLEELRNRRRRAREHLKHLDKSFGRLDKNLGHWLNENEQLSKMGAFAAYATMPASKRHAIRIPRKLL